MREARFIQLNAGNWKRMETAIADDSLSADALSSYYITLTDDLAYARTFYPQGSTIAYLNGLAAQFHQKIYRNRKEEKGRILWFWQYELPVLFYGYRRYFLYSFLFFLFFLLAGIVSATYDPSFVRLILGDNYVNMTLENIRKGNPFGVYQSGGQLTMFFQIAFNNIKVAFLSFISGIFFGIGPVILNMKNSIMLGAFESFFFQHGLGLKSISIIFIHGTLEIGSIIIAIASGMILGASLLFPGAYSRKEMLVRGGRDGLKIVFGLVPFFLVAAFLESFVTRYAQMPALLSWLILLLSLLFLIWYFLVYPVILHRMIQETKQNASENDHDNLTKWLQKKYNSEK